jgi:hypothetical protein
MDRALWLLLRLRFRAWLRRLGRNLFTLKGVLFTAFGTVLFASFLLPMILMRHARPGVDSQLVRQYGSLILMAYCLMTLISASGEPAVTFNLAEVNLLFAGPFSRRQLLAYKILSNVFAAVVPSIFMMMWLRQYASSFLTGFVALLLAMTFLNLFSMATSMLAGTVGAKAFTRRRKIVLGVLLTLGVVAIARGGGQSLALGPMQWLKSVEQTWPMHILLTPLRWFVEVLLAQHLWPDVIKWASLAIGVNGTLLAIVFALDAQFLEASGAASEKHYARLQRMRSSGLGAMRRPGSAKSKLGLPLFPAWGGVGPLAWRQLLSALRNLKSLLIFLGIFSLFAVGPMLMRARHDAGPQRLLFLLPFITIVTLPRLTFDFRGDLDRMDILKTLPISPIRLVLGQLIAPAILLAGLQLAVLLGVVAFSGVDAAEIKIALAFILPFDFLAVAIENLLFLWFPTRATPTTPGDLQFMGRQMLFIFAKFFMLAVAAGLAALAAAIVYFIFRLWAVALTAAWLVLVATVIGMLPLVALAFTRFDVSRDLPAES